MSNKKKKLNEPDVVQTSHTVLEGMEDVSKLNIKGFALRWVNVHRREDTGWGRWKPLYRDSDIGKKVTEMLGTAFDRFAGLSADTNLFYKGSDAVLAFCSEEENAEAKRANEEKSVARMRLIDGDPNAKLQKTQVVKS